MSCCYSGALRPDSRKCHKILSVIFLVILTKLFKILTSNFNSDSMGIASFVGVTTPTCDVITVNKLPGKFAHPYNKHSTLWRNLQGNELSLKSIPFLAQKMPVQPVQSTSPCVVVGKVGKVWS